MQQQQQQQPNELYLQDHKRVTALQKHLNSNKKK